jgi:hypothetical protein
MKRSTLIVKNGTKCLFYAEKSLLGLTQECSNIREPLDVIKIGTT